MGPLRDGVRSNVWLFVISHITVTSPLWPLHNQLLVVLRLSTFSDIHFTRAYSIYDTNLSGQKRNFNYDSRLLISQNGTAPSLPTRFLPHFHSPNWFLCAPTYQTAINQLLQHIPPFDVHNLSYCPSSCHYTHIYGTVIV